MPYLSIEAYPLEVEVDLARGLPRFSIVGLPDIAVKEARERVSSAIKNSAFEAPTKKITVNLAPADVKKEGSSFDLSILNKLFSELYSQSYSCFKS